MIQAPSTHKIRPAGSHLKTIGEDLIQDKHAAILELVKNSYDADSSEVIICFEAEKERLRISIEDSGHGMSYKDVIGKWLVPSTNNKVTKRRSPKGRIMQGRKGIGRYATNILGTNLLLETINQNVKTSLLIDWEEFKKADFLDEVDILIESKDCNEPNGTKLTIEAPISEAIEWKTELKKLRFELKKLIPPEVPNIKKEIFDVILKTKNIENNQEEMFEEKITPYPILDFSDYRISGSVDSNGIGKLVYTNQKARNTVTENIELDLGKTNCGNLQIDIRVYDRDKDSIDQLISRGLKHEETGNFLKILETRNLLNSLNGIGVYRNGFRIRPLGDSEFDWLKLNERRVQNPSQNIGSNQVIGYIHIESEEQSGLEETSARDGLKGNTHFTKLKEIVLEIITVLQKKRYIFRRNIGLNKESKVIERELSKLYDYSQLQKSISSTLKQSGANEETLEKVTQLLEQDQTSKNSIVDDIKNSVAIYQGQATLGKIINVILHEGRRPLNYFNNQIPNLEFQIDSFKKDNSEETLQEILSMTNGFNSNASVFVNLFSRLDPLAAKRKAVKKEYILSDHISKSIDVFQNFLQENEIEIIFNKATTTHIGWEQDIYTIFTNLIDNSIFWIKEKNKKNNCVHKNFIKIEIHDSENSDWEISYIDSGLGIDLELIESGVIFEPEFTTKPEGTGTGLGLAIAGEAAQRNNFELKAVYHADGAHFKIYPIEESQNEQ